MPSPRDTCSYTRPCFSRSERARAQCGQPGLEKIVTGSGALAPGATKASMVSASETSNGSPSFSGSMNILAMTPSFTSIE